jgi:transposase
MEWSGRAPYTASAWTLDGVMKEHRHAQQINSGLAAVGIDIGKNSFHVVGLVRRGAIVLRQKWSRGQVEARLANLPPCLIGMEETINRRQSNH